MKKVLLFAIMVMGIALIVSPGYAQEQKSSGDVEWDDGIIKFISDDGNFMTRFDVRMYINGGIFFEDGNNMSSGTHLRKARFAMKTKLWKTWRAEWDIDIAEGTVEAKDMFISYEGFKNSHFKAGNFKMPLGLEELTSSRFQTFVERAYPMLAFETDRRAGFEYSRWGEHYNLRSAVFGQVMDNVKNKNVDETGGGFGARLVVAPIRNDNMTLHTGLAYIQEYPDDSGNMVEFQSEPETKLGDVEILGLKVPGVHHLGKTGLEGAFVYKNISFQGEYIHTSISRIDTLLDGTFGGGYGYVSWVLTGETRPWDPTQGEFGQIIPKSNKLGAWELTARFSHLDLTDEKAKLLGGMANNITLGLNWYPNPNIRLILNYTIVDNSENATNDIEGNYDFSVLHAMLVAYF